MSPAERQRIPYLQMFQERLRQQQAAQGGQVGGPRQQTSPIASPQPGPTSPRFPGQHMPGPIPMSGPNPNPTQHGMPRMTNPLDPYDHMVRPGHMGPGGPHPQQKRPQIQPQMRPGTPRMAIGPQGPFPPGMRPPTPVEASQIGQAVSAGEALSSLASNAMAGQNAETPTQPGFKNGPEQSPKTGEKSSESPAKSQPPPSLPGPQPAVVAGPAPAPTATPNVHPAREGGEGHENLDDLLGKQHFSCFVDYCIYTLYLISSDCCSLKSYLSYLNICSCRWILQLVGVC